MGGTRLRGRVAAVLLVGAGALALVLSTVPAPAAASSTTITVLAGSATVTNGAGSRSAMSGDLVRPGDQVRTSADGHAVLTFIDGSTMVIEPSGSLVLEEATFRPGSVAVRVFQSVGLTWSSVSRLLAPGSRFEVRTPALTASVRGTAFEVEVAADGETRVRTSEGAVAVSNDKGEVIVGEGAETTAGPDQAPAPPSAPPPSTGRVLEIGSRAVLIVDLLGRACGQDDGRIVQQIPGCVVRDGEIVIADVERAGTYRLVVVADPGSEDTVVERTVGVAGETERTLDLPPTMVTATPAVSTARPTIEVTLPLGIGTVPVQLDLATATPVVRVTAVPTATAGSFGAPPKQLPPLPFGRATAAPTEAPAPTPTAAPTVTVPPAIQTVIPTAAPTIAVPSVILTTPTPAPTPEPTPETTPQPTPTPEPTPEPTPQPTPTPCPAGFIGIAPLCVRAGA